MKKTKNNKCPCGSGLLVDQCCLPYINGEKNVPTAESLMRSRYTAYCLNKSDYLLSSWHPSTRPTILENDAENTKWIRLKIVSSTKNTVEFIATCRIQGKAHKLHETSRFIFERPCWYYVNGEIHTT